MAIGICPLCGTEVRWATIDGERVALATIADVDGRYSLDPDDVERAHESVAPGHAGFKLHSETCSKQGGIGR